MGRECMWRCSGTHWGTGTFQMAHLLGENWRKGRSKTGKENWKDRGSHTREYHDSKTPQIQKYLGGSPVMYSTVDCTSSQPRYPGGDVVSNGGAYANSQQVRRCYVSIIFTPIYPLSHFTHFLICWCIIKQLSQLLIRKLKRQPIVIQTCHRLI